MEERTIKATATSDLRPTPVPPILLNAFDRVLLRLLLRFCNSRSRKTETEIDAERPVAEVDSRNLNKLMARFGDGLNIEGLRVLDAGCGAGDLAISMALAGAEVVGVDIDGKRITRAREKAQQAGAADRATFVHKSLLDYEPDRLFDRIVSVEAFEHIPEPERFLPKMRDLLAPGGEILSVFGPLWLSPYGPHQYGFTRFPWVHLVFPERVVLAARRMTFRPTDAATRYEDIRGGLNRMTVERFKRAVHAAGLRFERLAYNPQLSNAPAKLASGALTALPGAQPGIRRNARPPCANG